MASERIRESCQYGFVVDDAYPVACGHTLVIARRHTPNFFDLTPEEIVAVMGLLRSARERIDRSLRPGGYNVGINLGETAGQTVLHVHIHLIPRYAGDSPDPRGGVRNVIPGKGYQRVCNESGGKPWVIGH
ncbi:MAG: HIT domain-containing protein [Thermoguttaceae bacterium]|jgi:diadenosine tetraphosphate (Ap4A) HIT family hydrolase